MTLQAAAMAATWAAAAEVAPAAAAIRPAEAERHPVVAAAEHPRAAEGLPAASQSQGGTEVDRAVQAVLPAAAAVVAIPRVDRAHAAKAG
jgi:hypothetical protein